jgi:hypothetical protein
MLKTHKARNSRGDVVDIIKNIQHSLPEQMKLDPITVEPVLPINEETTYHRMEACSAGQDDPFRICRFDSTSLKSPSEERKERFLGAAAHDDGHPY